MHYALINFSRSLIQRLSHTLIELLFGKSLMGASQPFCETFLQLAPCPFYGIQLTAEPWQELNFQAEISSELPKARTAMHGMVVEDKQGLTRVHRQLITHVQDEVAASLEVGRCC